MERLNELSASTLAERIRAGAITSQQAVEQCIERIAERDDAVHAWVDFDPQRAIAEARARDREPPRGPLHGVPVGIKDIIDIAGLPTTCHSKILQDNVAREDAYLLSSLCVDLKISEIVDAGQYIVSAVLPQAVFGPR